VGRLGQNRVPPEATCDPPCSLEFLINIASFMNLIYFAYAKYTKILQTASFLGKYKFSYS
jgi:hypothetical protein